MVIVSEHCLTPTRSIANTCYGDTAQNHDYLARNRRTPEEVFQFRNRMVSWVWSSDTQRVVERGNRDKRELGLDRAEVVVEGLKSRAGT